MGEHLTRLARADNAGAAQGGFNARRTVRRLVHALSRPVE
jgi:hypothetical protein